MNLLRTYSMARATQHQSCNAKS